MKQRFRFGVATFNVLSLLFLFFILRLILLFHFRPEAAGSPEILKAFVIGLHLDLFVALVLTLPLVLWFTLIPNRWFAAGWHRFVFWTIFLLFWQVQIF